jgi:hypothetical protein
LLALGLPHDLLLGPYPRGALAQGGVIQLSRLDEVHDLPAELLVQPIEISARLDEIEALPASPREVLKLTAAVGADHPEHLAHGVGERGAQGFKLPIVSPTPGAGPRVLFAGVGGGRSTFTITLGFIGHAGALLWAKAG